MQPGEPNLFDGPVYRPEFDNVRLSQQIGRVYCVMLDGGWHTLEAIALASTSLRADGLSDPQSSISAQLRHLRKPRFGGHTIDKHQTAPGLFVYRMTPSDRGLLDGTRDEEDPTVPCPTCGGKGSVRPADLGPQTTDAD